MSLPHFSTSRNKLSCLIEKYTILAQSTDKTFSSAENRYITCIYKHARGVGKVQCSSFFLISFHSSPWYMLV